MTAVDLAPRALILGGTRGIGLSIAHLLAGRGFSLTIVGRTASDDSCRQLEAAGAPLVSSLSADLATDTGIDRICLAVEEGGRLDVLVLCAGGDRFRRFGATTAREIDASMRLNLVAHMRVGLTALPQLRRSGAGHVVLVGTILSREWPCPRAATYLPGKTGSLEFVHALFSEERENGLRVTAVLPDLTDTSLVPDTVVPDRTRLIRPETVAWAVGMALDAPREACVTEIQIRPQLGLARDPR